MKGRVLVLDEIGGRPAAALLVDGQIEELAVDPDGDAVLPGAIFRSVADRPMKGQGGIFVKLPGGSGFLRQISGVAPGQRLLVQVTGPAEAGKALPVTTRLLFKSRFAIVTPEAPGLNISRRIKDEDERAALQALAEAGMAGADARLGLILRSACDGAEDDAIAEDIAAMRGLCEAVLADLTGGPELLVDNDYTRATFEVLDHFSDKGARSSALLAAEPIDSFQQDSHRNFLGILSEEAEEVRLLERSPHERTQRPRHQPRQR